ncbi:MAG: hypothetical protein IJF56_06850 [Clostridia bacterium]|nr:hypothetical protein [Clostridia bacterium]
MKKALGILLVVLMSLSLFSGCGEKEPEPLRICMDLEYVNGEEDRFLEDDLKALLVTSLFQAGKLKDLDVPRDFEFENIPINGIEREAALERIRTEIMSGKGPDIFLLACNAKNSYIESLFTMPEKAMELSLFLTLDDYMESNSYFAEWDRMNSAVLKAGRTQEGQQIIPLCYTLPVAIYRKEEVTHTPSRENTWMDMLESEDEALAAAAVWTDNTNYLSEGMPFMTSRAPMTEFILGAIADYEEEELLFTEEELNQRLHEICMLADRYTAGDFDLAPDHFVEFIGQKFDEKDQILPFDVRNGLNKRNKYELIPLYSDDGGVTAEITVYAAINRNTRRPDDAFRVLDYLASYEAQRRELIYQFIYECGNRSSIPMYTDLMSESQRVYRSNPLVDFSMKDWCLIGENYQELCSVREQITHVRFCDALNMELDKLYWDYLYAEPNEDVRNKIVSEYYRNMQRILRE